MIRRRCSRTAAAPVITPSAAEHAVAAAQKAMAALAFDRAAWLYHQALDLTATSPATVGVAGGLADALAHAGRPGEAAEAYVRAADASEPAQRVELQRARRRAIPDRRTYRPRDGRHARRPRRRSGSSCPARHAPRSCRSCGTGRDCVGAAWTSSSATPRQVAAEDLLRIDIYWSVVTGLGMVDMMRTAAFSARLLRLALDAGEPSRLVRALAVEAMFIASVGQSHHDRAVTLVARARDLAERLGRPYPMAMSSVATSMTAIFVGRWQQARHHSEQALPLLRDQCVGVTWELNTTHILFLWSLMYLGELGELARQLPPLLTQALDRGNLALATELRTRMNLTWLAADEPDEGDRQVRESLAGWSQTGFHRQHYSGMLANAQTELYRGDAEARGIESPRTGRCCGVRGCFASRSFASKRGFFALEARSRSRHARKTITAGSRRRAMTPAGSPRNRCHGRIRWRCY